MAAPTAGILVVNFVHGQMAGPCVPDHNHGCHTHRRGCRQTRQQIGQPPPACPGHQLPSYLRLPQRDPGGGGRRSNAELCSRADSVLGSTGCARPCRCRAAWLGASDLPCALRPGGAPGCVRSARRQAPNACCQLPKSKSSLKRASETLPCNSN